VFLPLQEMNDLVRSLGAPGSGAVRIDDLLAALVPALTPRRAAMVRKVFAHAVARTHHDEYGLRALPEPEVAAVPLAQFEALYQPALHPEVAAGRRRADELADHLHDSLAALGGGEVTLATLLAYYTDLGCPVASDDWFVSSLARAWGVRESDRDAVAEERVQSYLATVREKARQKAGPRETERQRLRRAFVFFDDAKDGRCAFATFRVVLEQLGVPLKLSEARLVFDRFPQRDGALDYSAFVEVVYEGIPL
jgi:hypothetical protein